MSSRALDDGAGLCETDATDLVARLRSGELSAREVVLAHLERISSDNPRLNALTVVCDDEAVAAADLADRTLLDGGPIGPLHGVPFTVKGNIDTAGLRTSSGMCAGPVAHSDAPVVAHLRAAGAILIGQSNMPDLGIRWHTESAVAGATKNPLAPAQTPGGSSGGAAAACASGMAPINLGNDGGGSIRYPSACCGVVGIRPTRGRVPTGSTIGAETNIVKQLVNVEGLIARSVRDIDLVLRIMARPSVTDPEHVPVPLPVRQQRREFRVGVVGLDEPSLDPAVRRTLGSATDLLERCGSHVERVELDVRQALAIWSSMACCSIANSRIESIEHLGEASREFIELFVRVARDSGANMPLWEALTERHKFASTTSSFMGEYDVLVMPVSGQPPFAVDADLDEGQLPAIFHAQRFLVAANILGWPSLSVPIDTSVQGVPTGVQVMAPSFREDRCIEVGELLAQELSGATAASVVSDSIGDAGGRTHPSFSD